MFHNLRTTIPTHTAVAKVRVNIVYAYLRSENIHEVHRGNLSVVWSPVPLNGCDHYVYHNAFSYRGRLPGLNILMMLEPAVVLPGEFDDRIWRHFDYVLTLFDALLERGDKFRKIFFPHFMGKSYAPLTEDLASRRRFYPTEGRRNAICMINGYKRSSVPGELYSRRVEIAQWFHDHSDIPFDVYGTPAFPLPNYKGALDVKLSMLKQYKYCLCFENTDHPVLSAGYITEKILDCLETRTIPIYLGASNIDKYIPAECFIDYRKFAGLRELDEFLHTLPDEQYENHIANIDKFVSSGKLRKFSSDSLNNAIVDLLIEKNFINADGLFRKDDPWIPETPLSLPQGRWSGSTAPVLWTWNYLQKESSPLLSPELVKRERSTGSTTISRESKVNILSRSQSIHVLYIGLKYAGGSAARGYDSSWWNIHDGLKHFLNVKVSHYDYMLDAGKNGIAGMSENLVALVKKNKPDLLILNQNSVAADVVREALSNITKQMDTVTIAWMGDDHRTFDDQSQLLAPCLDYLITTNAAAISKYQQLGFSGKIIKSQWACNPYAYFPMPAARRRDMSFIGMAKDDRATVITLLREQGLKIEVFGRNWPNGMDIPLQEMVRIFCESRINLNITSLASPALQHINSRIFEVPGCRGFLITSTAKDLERYYIPDEEIVVASSIEELTDKARHYLSHDTEREAIARRGYQRTMQEHTWAHRFGNILSAIGFHAIPAAASTSFQERNIISGAASRSVSISVCAYNNLEYTKLCIESILHFTPGDYELLLADNGSTDGTLDYFESIKKIHPRTRVIKYFRNNIVESVGNYCMSLTNSEYFVSMTNDLLVHEHWCENFIDQIDAADDIGVVGPRSNSISGPQYLPCSYQTIEEYAALAEQLSQSNKGRSFAVDRMVGMCYIMKKKVFERVGGVDPELPTNGRDGGYGFSDDDLSVRLRLAGYRMLVADDVLIHHYGSKTVSRNRPDIFEKPQNINKGKYLKKLLSNPRVAIGKHGEVSIKPFALNEPVPLDEKTIIRHLRICVVMIGGGSPPKMHAQNRYTSLREEFPSVEISTADSDITSWLLSKGLESTYDIALFLDTRLSPEFETVRSLLDAALCHPDVAILVPVSNHAPSTHATPSAGGGAVEIIPYADLSLCAMHLRPVRPCLKPLTGAWQGGDPLWFLQRRIRGDGYFVAKANNLIVTSGQAPERHPYDALVLPEQLVSDNRYAEAAEIYKEDLRRDPSFVQSHYQLACILHKGGRPVEAIQEIEHALKIDPDYIEAYVFLSRYYLANGSLAQAEQYVRLAQLKQPGNTEVQQLVDEFAERKSLHQKTIASKEKEIETLLALVNQDAAQGKWFEAATKLYEFISKHPEAGVCYAALGSVLARKGDLAGAIEPLERAVKLLPNEPTVGVQLAQLYRAVGLQKKAVEQIIETVNKAPADPDALFTFATIAGDIGNDDAAQATLSELAKIAPNYPGMKELQNQLAQKHKTPAQPERNIDDNPDQLLRRGNAFLAAREWQKAIDDFECVIKLLPNVASELNPCLGYAYSQIGRFEEAVACYKKILMDNPRSAAAYYNLGKAYKDQGNFDSAKSCYTDALELDPKHVDSCFNLANLNRNLGELDDAISWYEKTLKLAGTHFGALCNMGVAYREKGELSKAEKIYNEAISIKPNFADAYWNLGIVNLLRGDFQEGWKGYEWRWRKSDFAHAKRDFKQPQWDGSSLTGKTILVHAEQGMGDMIQCLRFLPLLAQRGGKVIVECQKELMAIARTVQGVQEVIPRGKPLPFFDVHCPVMTLPSIFVNSLEQIPAAVPYISLDSAVREKWLSILKRDPAQFKVGIVWAGNQQYKNDMNRSCPITVFAKLFNIDRVSFYSLQKGEPAAQLRDAGKFGNVIDTSAELNDFMDTACLMECLDLVISVDTAAAHLAGSLGKNAWTLLPFAPDWRWMLSRNDSPWYPTMRLFRQKKARDWECLIDIVREALQDEIKKQPAQASIETAAAGRMSARQPSSGGLISIILYGLHQRKVVQQCLSSIKLNTPEPHEVIFITEADDAGMKWLKHETASYPAYRIVQTSLASEFVKSFNHAIQESTGDYLVLMSADCCVSEHWLSDMITCLTHTPAAGIVGPMTNLGQGLQKTDLILEDLTDKLHEAMSCFRMRNHHRRTPTGKVSEFCMLFKKSLVQEIGLFEEKLGLQTFADDYCLRATLLGHKNMIAGDVYVHRSTTKDHSRNTLSDRKTLKNKWNNIDMNSALGRKLIVMTAIEQAWEFQGREQTENAAELLLKEIKRNPNERELYYNFAEIVMQTKQFKEALDVLAMMSQDDLDMRKLILTGYCEEGLGHHDDAERIADQVLISGKHAAKALNLKGAVAYIKGDSGKAEFFFKQAIDCDPGYGEPYTNLGILKWAEKKIAEALDLLERGFILSPTITDIAVSYYSAITSEKAWNRVERIFQEAKSLHPSNRRIVFLLIEILLRVEKHISAMDEIEKAIIRFGIDDGIIKAALAVRKKIGPVTIRKSSKRGATLSLCMIVKNEVRSLAKCLSSVKNIVDEMIVVDTGSTDGTRDIAEVFGAQLYDFPWNGNFSEARNYSLGRANGDWVLVLDADEVISHQDHAALRSLIAPPSAVPPAYTFATRNYLMAVHNIGWIANDGMYPDEETGTGWVSSTKVRLFVRDKRIQFVNPVHELVEPSLKRIGAKVKYCAVPIHHYGKMDTDFDVLKGQEYYLLGKKKLEEKGNDLNAIQELAIQAAGLGKNEEARDLWRQALSIRPDMLAAHINIANTYLIMNNFTEALDSAKKAIALGPGMREVICNYAVCELYAGDIERSVEVLESFIKKEKEYPLAIVMLLAAYFGSGKKDKGSELLTSLKLTGSSAFADAISPFINKLMQAGRVGYANAILEALLEHKISSNRILSLHKECEGKMLMLETTPEIL